MAKKSLALSKVYGLLEPGPIELAKQVVKVGNCSGRDVDKFAAFGLTPKPASMVQPPLIDECFANLECRVVDTRMVNAYNFFVLEVVKAWHDPAGKDPAPSTTAAVGPSWWRGRRSSCRPG